MTFQSLLSVRASLSYTRKTYQFALRVVSYVRDKN